MSVAGLLYNTYDPTQITPSLLNVAVREPVLQSPIPGVSNEQLKAEAAALGKGDSGFDLDFCLKQCNERYPIFSTPCRQACERQSKGISGGTGGLTQTFFGLDVGAYANAIIIVIALVVVVAALALLTR